jgi:hypothetical protein
VNENIMQEIVHELFSSLEALETQSAAILQFLKDKGVVDKQELAPYLEQAGNASSVRWRAARVRIDYLISSAAEAEERDKKESSKPKEESQESSTKTDGQTSVKNEGDKEVQETKPVASSQKPEGTVGGTTAAKDRKQTDNETQNENEKTDEKSGENAREKAA